MGCGVWGVGCGVWGVGCGVWGVGKSPAIFRSLSVGWALRWAMPTDRYGVETICDLPEKNIYETSKHL